MKAKQEQTLMNALLDQTDKQIVFFRKIAENAKLPEENTMGAQVQLTYLTLVRHMLDAYSKLVSNMLSETMVVCKNRADLEAFCSRMFGRLRNAVVVANTPLNKVDVRELDRMYPHAMPFDKDCLATAQAGVRNITGFFNMWETAMRGMQVKPASEEEEAPLAWELWADLQDLPLDTPEQIANAIKQFGFDWVAGEEDTKRVDLRDLLEWVTDEVWTLMQWETSELLLTELRKLRESPK